MTYREILKNEEVNAYIKKGNANLDVLGFTDHSQAHSALVAERAAEILQKLGYSEHEMELAKIAGAKIADITRNSITLECCDTTDRLENLLDLCRPYGLKEVIRTGTIALEKGNEQLTID